MIDLKNKPLTVVFRVDSGFEIGSGHFVRCLTLARTLRDFGHSIRFVCRQHQGSLHHRAEAEGFALSILDPPYSSSKVKYKEGLTHGSFLGVDQVDDLNDVLA
ncbi:MAG: hypothetical protein NTV34_19295, partial [Proteobacteria bacterium]|nr:hypothetical protein [Pseudomonadota bacterium]